MIESPFQSMISVDRKIKYDLSNSELSSQKSHLKGIGGPGQKIVCSF